jgi:hypothetical protein
MSTYISTGSIGGGALSGTALSGTVAFRVRQAS